MAVFIIKQPEMNAREKSIIFSVVKLQGRFENIVCVIPVRPAALFALQVSSRNP